MPATVSFSIIVQAVLAAQDGSAKGLALNLVLDLETLGFVVIPVVKVG